MVDMLGRWWSLHRVFDVAAPRVACELREGVHLVAFPALSRQGPRVAADGVPVLKLPVRVSKVLGEPGHRGRPFQVFSHGCFQVQGGGHASALQLQGLRL